MIIVLLTLVAGLMLLLWSADRFVEGSAAVAKHLGLSPLLIGMVIIGFGTSTPEMLVSALAAGQGNPGMALGNAYGSNITNIAFILGLSALIYPVRVRSSVLKKELPLLMALSLVAALQIHDGFISRWDALLLLLIFTGLMVWTLRQNIYRKTDALNIDMQQEMTIHPVPMKKAIIFMIFGLLLLIGSSRVLVWSAIKIAIFLGVSDTIIGLTIVAVGTSLPELASSVAAARKGEHDLALGNILGSNLFNTLVVVGLAGLIRPLTAEKTLILRDIPVMLLFTFSLFIMGFGFRKEGRINRLEGAILLIGYCVYNLYLIFNI
jgi:cation:H+ antiporter